MDLNQVPAQVWQNGLVAALLFLLCVGLFLMYRSAQQTLIKSLTSEITTLRAAVANYQVQTSRMADGLETVVRFIEKLPEAPKVDDHSPMPELPRKSDYGRPEGSLYT